MKKYLAPSGQVWKVTKLEDGRLHVEPEYPYEDSRSRDLLESEKFSEKFFTSLNWTLLETE